MHAFPGAGTATPLNPSKDFMYGFKGPEESVEHLIEEDRRLLVEIGVTHEQLAGLIDDIFATEAEEFCGCPIVRWENIHSPVCPWDDFVTKPCLFDMSLAVTEIWLCNPHRVRELSEWSRKIRTNGYPIEELRRLVDQEWIMVLSDLHPHLLRAHHFLEGHQTPYRIQAKKLAGML